MCNECTECTERTEFTRQWALWAQWAQGAQGMTSRALLTALKAQYSKDATPFKELVQKLNPRSENKSFDIIKFTRSFILGNVFPCPVCGRATVKPHLACSPKCQGSLPETKAKRGQTNRLRYGITYPHRKCYTDFVPLGNIEHSYHEFISSISKVLCDTNTPYTLSDGVFELIKLNTFIKVVDVTNACYDSHYLNSLADTALNNGQNYYIVFTSDALAFWCEYLTHLLRNDNVRIPLDECVIKEVPNEQAKEFLMLNSVQGPSKTSLALGIFYHDMPLEIMAYAKARYNQNRDYECLRMVRRLGYTVFTNGCTIATPALIKHHSNPSINKALF